MQTKDLNKKQIIIVSLVSFLLVAFAVGLDLIIKAEPGKEGGQAATASEATASAAGLSSVPGYQYAQLSSRLTEIVEEEPYEPSPSVLNLAYFYPDGADTSDVINSYAGRLYTELTTKEAQYMAEIYDMSERTPQSMAQQLGLPTSRIMGKYNPKDSSQDPDNPATWKIGSFKNANVAFYDGDGNRINAYSAVKEIMAMASVYSYFHDMYDSEAMQEYAEELWEHSHSYRISMGNVYYCSGCLNRTIQEEAEEAIAQEQQQLLLEESLAKRTAESSGSAPAVYTLPETDGPANDLTEADEEATMPFISWNGTQEEGTGAGRESLGAEEAPSLIYSGGTGAEQSQTSAAGGESSSEESGSEAGASGEQAPTLPVMTKSETRQETTAPSTTVATTAPETTAPATTAAPTTVAPETTAAPQTEATVPAAEEAAAGEATLAAFSGIEGAEGLSYRGAYVLAENEEATLPGLAPAAQETGAPAAAASGTSAAPQTTAQTQAAETAAVQTTQEAQGATLPETARVEGPGAALMETSGREQRADEASLAADVQEQSGGGTTTRSVSTCPGHIDLYITVTIYGIDDMNGLVQRDTMGNDEANFNESWQGWTQEMLGYARALNSEDWFKRYGLTISAINVRNPLTESEIDAYLARIPDSVSQQRKDIVSFALHSVGKVPYYWGGKPSGPRYESNNFGTIVPPDTKGRVLRGLDCSGWINWVYWSVTGQRLAGQSTGTLIGCGERIARSELAPGDIIVRTGADAHVVMFLEWAGNGNMIVVHETGGVTNNVTVSEMSANWPYYRRLIQ